MALTQGEKDLAKLLATMKPALQPTTYAFASVQSSSPVPTNIKPLMTFTETEGTTLIVPLSDAQSQKLEYTFPCRQITLKVHSSLEAVGFLAAITNKLKDEGMSCNPVSGFYHDHLFVKEDEADKAMEVLQDLVDESDLRGNKMVEGFANAIAHFFGVGDEK